MSEVTPEAGAAANAFFEQPDSGPDGQGAGEQQETQEQEGQENAEGQEPSHEELQAEIAKLRKEAASYRIKAREAKKAAASKTAGTPSADDVAAAEERGREAARLEYGVKLAGARVEAALAGVVPDERIPTLVAHMNLSQYVTEDGDVDEDAVKDLRDEYVALLGKKPTKKVSHGRATESPTTQKSEEQQWASDFFKV